MRKPLPLLVFLFLPLLVLAQTVTVPSNVYFADIHLKISDGARQEIQKKVDALHRSPAHFKLKVDLADAYFPIIERVFKEEGVPDDFKYLAIQESGLIGDAVSTSNAVGYWQFKREAAMDFNLRMDQTIDERRHITEASRGAARYFKRSNTYYNNWFNSLLSYYLGYTGAKAYAGATDNGARSMDVTEKSHPYVLTFLAHKIAYDNFVGKTTSPVLSLRELRATPGQSLSEIALATKTDYAELAKYNKWLLGDRIPSDKDYYVMVPVRNGNDSGLLAYQHTERTTTPRLNQQVAPAALVKRNGLNALVARPGDTKDKLALQAGIATRRFLKYNDLHSFDEIVAGTAYYIEQKYKNAASEYHVVQPGETMQMIAQHYGIRLNYLRFKNRMGRHEVAVPGRVLWLQKRRPAHKPIEVRNLDQQPGQSTNPLAFEASEITPAPEAEARPKENIFSRFINSLKGNTLEAANEEDPAQEAPATPAAKPAVQTVEGTTATAPAPAPAQPALYPAAKQTVAKTTTPVHETAEAESTEEEVEQYLTAGQQTSEAPQQVTVSEESVPGKVATDQAQAKATKHVVKQGETLYSISRQYAVTVDELVLWNELGETPLKIGQELHIAQPLTQPGAEDAPEAPATLLSTTSAYHIVAAGETLYQLSRKYNVSTDALRTWNNLTDNTLKAGQELRVQAPAATAAPAKPLETAPEKAATANTGNLYHTVAAGESMYQISRKYGVTIKDIMEWNNKADFSVSAGEKLLIKQK